MNVVQQFMYEICQKSFTNSHMNSYMNSKKEFICELMHKYYIFRERILGKALVS